MAEDGLTYSEAVRAAAAEAAAALGTIPEAVRAAPALGTLPEAVRQRAPRTRRHPGNSGKARVLLDVDAEKDKPAHRKRPDVQPADAQMIATLEACISDLRSMLAKAEERSSDAPPSSKRNWRSMFRSTLSYRFCPSTPSRKSPFCRRFLTATPDTPPPHCLTN
jgi:hypothetical protein